MYIILGNECPTLYIGVTSDLAKRMWEHRTGIHSGFAKKYNLTKLFYFESSPTITEAIAREKQLKGWHREWKLNLIKAVNSDFRDLSVELDAGTMACGFTAES